MLMVYVNKVGKWSGSEGFFFIVKRDAAKRQVVEHPNREHKRLVLGGALMYIYTDIYIYM